MNIAIIAGQLVVGGAEKQLYLWLANIDRIRYHPIVITLHPGHDDYWEVPIENLGIPIYRVKHSKNRLWRFSQILRILHQHRPDLVHGWHTFASPYAGLSAKFFCAKSIGGIRSSIHTLDQTWETRLTRLLCDAVVSNSQTTAQSYKIRLNRKKQRVYTVQNAIDTDFVNRGSARKTLVTDYGLPDDSIWVASIGRMYPLKRFDLLLQIAAKFKSKTPKAHFVLIGDGPERSSLEHMVHQLGLDGLVTFTGEVPRVNRWMMGFDVFCFPSTDEGMPNVVLEAAAAGLPIVAWRYPFIEELLVDSEMALLAQPGDLESMADALWTLVNNPQIRQRLGAAAQKHVKSNFSIQRYVQEMTAVYDSLLFSNPKLKD